MALGVLYAGLQVLLLFVVRGPYSRGLSWPVTLVGIAAAVLLISGYMPVPFEILKRRGRVVGIDLIFLTIDWFGAFFSLMALGEIASLHFTLYLKAWREADAMNSGSKHL